MSYVAVIVALALMRSDEITPIRTVARAKGQVRAGLRYVWGDPDLREVLSSVVLVGLLAFNFTVTLPLLALKVLHGSAADYSFITCSMGLGGLLGGLYVAHRSRPTRRLLALLSLAFGVLMAAVAVAPSILLACLAVVPMGAASLAFVSTANATLQLGSAEEMRGRVMSLYAMGFLGTTPIGALVVSAHRRGLERARRDRGGGARQRRGLRVPLPDRPGASAGTRCGRCRLRRVGGLARRGDLRLLREPERPLADHVALDLGGAAPDRL